MKIKRSLVTPKAACTGCTACKYRCPTKAISMQADEEGFSYPVVDTTTCIECDLCNQVCPAEEAKPARVHIEAQNAYVCWSHDEHELKLSSSGGVFSLLAHEVFALKGVTCGALYDDQLIIHHDFARNAKELQRMRGSKYVQSDLRDCLEQTKKYLKNNTPVLFSGTPCQIAGLKAYLAKDSNHPLLLCAEIVCEGTPSPGLFKSYVNYCCPDFYKVNYFSLRDKNYRISKLFLINYQTVQGETKFFLKKGMQDPYLASMAATLSLRPACYQCGYKEGRSGADLCMGDCWAEPLLKLKTSSKCGASSLIIYTQKGQEWCDKLHSQLAYKKEVSALASTIRNGYIYRSPAMPVKARKQFFINAQSQIPLDQNFEQSNIMRHRVGIINHAGHSNHGSNLTAYALQEHLRREGYIAHIISLRPYQEVDNESFAPYSLFAEKMLIKSQAVYGANDCAQLNAQFDTFIAGSDQIWRYPQSHIRQNAFMSFFLEFAQQGKRRIAYAGSFGREQSGAPAPLLVRMQKAFQDLDAISAREQDGIKNLQAEFQIPDDIPLVVDPVFLLSKRDWLRFSETSEEQIPPNLLMHYFFFSSERMLSPLSEFAKEQGLCTQDLRGAVGTRDTLDWLYAIEKAQLLVTDSYHALCFAIIFERPFIAVSTRTHGMSRLESLLDKLELSERLIDLETLQQKEILERLNKLNQNPIDYSCVQTRLKPWSEQSSQWLQRALQQQPKIKNHILEANEDAIFNERDCMRQHLRGLAIKHAKACLKLLFKRRIKEARYYFYLARKYRKLAKRIP